MSSSKEIKFKFVVDEQSAQRVNRVLDEMIKRAQDLAKTLQGVGSPGGGSTGLLGKGTVGGGVGRASPQSTMASAASSTTQKVSFASVIGQNVDMLKKMGTEGSMAMKAMSDALAAGVTKQKSSIGALEGELSRLVKMYKDVEVQGSSAFSSKVRNQIAETTSKLGSARKELAELQKAQSQATESEPEAGTPKLGAFARFRGFLNSGGGIGSQEASMASLSKIPVIGGMFSGMGLGGGLAMGGASMIAGLAVKAAITAASNAYNAPQAAQAARAEAAGVGPSSYARKIRAGDQSDIRAMQEIGNDADKTREFGEIEGKGGGFWNAARRAGIGFSAASKAFGRGEFGDALRNVFSGTDSVDAQNIIKGRKREYINNAIEERGVLEDIDRDATSGAMGKMAMQRALGIGNGRKKTGAYVSNSEKFMNAYSQFDAGELQAALGGIMSGGTRQAAYAKIPGGGSLFSSVLQAQAAGIGNAGSVGGIFSRQGAGRGLEMVDLLRSVAGAGTDVSTTGLIGDYLGKAADQINMPQFNGAGALGALSFQTQGPQGAMVARQNIAGQASLQNLYSGGRDAAQKAINFSLARSNAPDAGYYAQDYLANKLDANRIADALGPGKFTLTDEEKNLGLTPDMIRRQARSVQASQRFRVMEKGFAPGSDAQKMLKALKGGADPRQYALENFAGKDGVYNDEEREKAMGVYSTLLRAGNGALSESQATGQARLEMFGLGQRTKKGKMAGDVAGGSFEAKVAKEEAGVREMDRSLKDADMDRLESQNADISKKYRRLVTNSENLAVTANNITEIISTFAKNLKAAAGGPSTSPNTRVAPKE